MKEDYRSFQKLKSTKGRVISSVRYASGFKPPSRQDIRRLRNRTGSPNRLQRTASLIYDLETGAL